MARQRGRRTWIFPDTELPPAGNSLLKGHESVIILNMTSRPVVVQHGRLDARQGNLACSTTMGYAV